MKSLEVKPKTPKDSTVRILAPVRDYFERPSGLLHPEELLRDYFGKPVNESSLKWLWRQRRARNIPSIKLGREVFFDLNEVKAALANRQTVRAK